MTSTNIIDKFKNYLGPWWLNLIVGSVLLGMYLFIDSLINQSPNGAQFVNIIITAIGFVGDLILFLSTIKVLYILFTYFKKLSKKLKIIIISCLAVLLLLPLIDFGIFNSTIKSYRISKRADDNNYKAFNFIDTYKVLSHEVIGTNEGLNVITFNNNISSSLYTYKDCDIYNRSNWFCKIDGEDRYFGFKNGIWTSGYDMDISGELTNNILINGVSKIKYLFYRLNGSFY